jgi:acetyltransferase-like isoleucine patch superfamily enzyme
MDGARISNVAITSACRVEIGMDTFIGAGCGIFDTDFHSTDWEERVNKMTIKENISTSAVIVGNRVFIGTRCLILKGVHIGDEAIIGAGSVVTRSIPPGQIWAGNPAKFVKDVSSRSCVNPETRIKASDFG